MQVLRYGDTGPAVADVKATLSTLGLLAAAQEQDSGTFDSVVEHAVRTFQQQRGLIPDGVIGPTTARALRDASYRLGGRTLAYLVSQPVTGDDVLALQERLSELGYNAGRPDGLFGTQTEHALRDFQRDFGVVVDGICGPATIAALGRLVPRVSGGRPVFLREQEQVRNAGPLLRGKRIVIDPGHGGSDHGVAVNAIREVDLMWDLARRLEGQMMATGMEAFLTRGPDHCPSEAERATFANETGADLFISLHLDANQSPQAQGVASFHYGNIRGTTSTVGETLAEFIQRELVARTNLLDCRSHPRTWDSLRLTKCPAVRVEIGYLTNSDDREKLTDPATRDVIAEGILIAIKRLYLLGQDDYPTGTFTVGDILRHELATAE